MKDKGQKRNQSSGIHIDQNLRFRSVLHGQIPSMAIGQPLLPPFVEKYCDNFPPSLIEQDIESLGSFRQYLLLKKGIEIIGTIVCRKAVDIYQEDPCVFKDPLSLKRPPQITGDPL